MEFILIWIVFGCAAFSVAKGKNRNPWLWLALGLILGPIAVLIIALMKAAPGADQGYH